MDTKKLIADIDAEIAKLMTARAHIAALGEGTAVRRGPGRPPKSVTATPVTRKRHTMSAAGRKAIAAAQKKRWAASKKATK